MPKYIKTQRIYQNSKYDVVVNLEAVARAERNEVIKTATNVYTVDGNTIALDIDFERFVQLLGNDVTQ